MITNKLLGAILLIGGTAIGAGMLALPVATGIYGFMPAVMMFLVMWLMMVFAALLMLEVNLWLEPGTNIVSMAQATLGGVGQALTWFVYLLLLYSVMSAYLAGISVLIQSIIATLFHIKVDPMVGASILVVFFAAIVYVGTRAVDYINRFLMIGLISAFVLLTISVLPYIKLPLLASVHIPGVWLTLPILSTAFGYQIVIPSLRSYLDSNVVQLRKAVIIGGVLPLLIYLAWEFVILGVIPARGHESLVHILEIGQPTVGLTKTLSVLLSNGYISKASSGFSFFAIATSFIGVGLSLFDFLADGLHIKKSHAGKLLIAVITLAPPMMFVLHYPRGFIMALEYAGVFVAGLLLMLPALMVLSGRYVKKIAHGYRAPGGAWMPLLIIAFSLLVIWFALGATA